MPWKRQPGWFSDAMVCTTAYPLGEVAVDLPAVQDADEDDSLSFEDHPDPILSYAYSVVGTRTAKLLDLRHFGERVRALDGLDGISDTAKDGLLSEPPQIIGEALFEPGEH